MRPWVLVTAKGQVRHRLSEPFFWGKHLYFRVFIHTVNAVNLGVKQTAKRGPTKQQYWPTLQTFIEALLLERELYMMSNFVIFIYEKEIGLCNPAPLPPLICGSCTSQLLSPSSSFLCFLRCHSPFCPTRPPFTDFYFVQIYILKKILYNSF